MPSALDSARQVALRFPDIISAPLEFRGEVSISVRDAARMVEVMSHLKSELQFDMLLDVCGVDHMGTEPRFEIVYHLYSFSSRAYLRVKTFVGEEAPMLPSVCGVWKAADWHEREVFDMLGVRFTGHPDLRRIIMWEEYPHHPLRKEFPLAGLPVDDVVKPAPMAGGPFVTAPGDKTTYDREPRGKGETDSVVR